MIIENRTDRYVTISTGTDTDEMVCIYLNPYGKVSLRVSADNEVCIKKIVSDHEEVIISEQ